MEEQLAFDIGVEDVGRRIDSFLAEETDRTRSALQNLLEDGCVLVNHQKVKKNYKLSLGDSILINLPLPQETTLLAENIPLDIIYEDEDIIVVNKPRGMVVHPAPGNWTGTLVNALMYHCKESLSGIGGEIRPGIVHRIDKDTSGLLVVCKNDKAHLSLAAQIKAHTAKREYQAVVTGNLKETQGSINKPVGRHPADRKKMAVTEKNSREAITHFRLITNYRGFAHVAFTLETGRTHQIRVHMAALGHPVTGDPLYCHFKDVFHLGGQCLHAGALTFVHPRTGIEMQFTAPLPPYFSAVVEKLKGQQV